MKICFIAPAGNYHIQKWCKWFACHHHEVYVISFDDAKCEYAAFLDSDDLWTPEKLEKQIEFMENTKTVFSCTAYEQIDEDGQNLLGISIPPEKTDYRKMIRLSDPIGNLTVMYDQEKIGKYEVPPIQKRNDFALWLRILRDVEYCAGMQEVLAYYRIRSNSVSHNKLSLAKYHWQLYHDIEGMGMIQSIYGMACWMLVKGIGIGSRTKKIRFTPAK